MNVKGKWIVARLDSSFTGRISPEDLGILLTKCTQDDLKVVAEAMIAANYTKTDADKNSQALRLTKLAGDILNSMSVRNA